MTIGRVDDAGFESLVLLNLADRIPSRLVNIWHRRNPGAILLERKFLGDPNDVRKCVIIIAERIVSEIQDVTFKGDSNA